MEDKSICTRFTAGVWRLLQRIQMQPESSVPAHLTIIPLKTGSFPIFLRLRSVEDGRLIDLDTIKKEILIEESGEIKDSSQSFAIDLVSEKRQVFDIHLAFPENIVANTRQCWLYAYADFLGPSIEVDPVTEKPRSVESIFRKPYGCGEQNMLVSGPNVYTHAYLASIGVIINGTLKFRESVKRIREGYELELKHRSDKVGKRAFAVWRNHQPSTWLNAFVDKVFTKASEHIPNLDPICSSLEWLLTQQAPDFHFKELRKPIHREMHGAVGGKFTLTAYVAISLLETQERPKCSDVLNANIQVAVKNAVAFLKTNIHHKTFTRPYALALLSYTLALHDPDTNTARATFNRLLSLSVVENGKIHWNGGHSGQQLDGTDVHPYWYKRKPLAVNVETTAYALLAQIAMSKPQFPVSQSTLDRARKMVLWLVSERTSGGTFISTQDTVIGLQALATYETWIKALEKDQPKKQSEFSIQFSVPSHWNNPAPTLKINGDNIGERQEIEVPDKVIRSGQDIRAVATGQGEGLLSYRCTYRTVVEEIPCHFTIDYKIAVLNVNDVNPNREDRALMRIKFELTVSKEKGDVTQMAVVEVGILSGFAPVISSLDRLSKADAVDGIVDSYEVRTYKVILYLRRITNSSLTLAFHMVQNVEVNKPEPAKINVYDYYEPEVQCGLFYSLPGIVPDLRTANCDKPPGEETNGICKCAEGGCPTCRSHTDQLQSTACLSGKKNCKLCKDWKTCTNMYLLVCDSVINYVYEIKVKSLTIPKNNEVFHSFVGEVKKVLKYGSDEQVKTGSEVVFEMRSDCYRKCWNKDLIKNKANADWKRAQIITVGRQLTIMGIQPEEIVDRDGNHQNKYLLDEHAVVERKITEKKYTKTKERLTKYCPDSKIHNRCDDLEKIIQAYNNFETLAERLKQGCD